MYKGLINKFCIDFQVSILNLLKKPEFENFIPVLDTYIAKTFSASALYK